MIAFLHLKSTSENLASLAENVARIANALEQRGE